MRKYVGFAIVLILTAANHKTPNNRYTAREVTQTFMQKVAGQQVTGIISAGHTPSEQINGKAVPQSDFFALGRTFVYFLTGKSPDYFHEDGRNGKLIWQDELTGISQKLLDLIDYLISPFPGNRPKDTQEILQKLSDFDTSSPTFQTSNSSNQSSNSVTNAQTVTSTSGAVNQVATSYTYPFWRRIIAFMIDLVISIFIGFITYIIAYIIGHTCGDTDICLNLAINTFLGGSIICNWLYFVLFESSGKQSTFGKIIFKIVVTNTKGSQISFWGATWRLIIKILLTLFTFGLLDLIFVIFNEKHRSLHDILSGTMVIKKPSP